MSAGSPVPGSFVAVFTDRYVDYQKFVVDNVAATLRHAGYGVLCVCGRELATGTDAAGEAEVSNALYRLTERATPAGIVCLSGNVGYGVDRGRLGEFLHRFDRPKVSIGVEVEGVPSVIVDDSRGMERLVEHLVRDCSRERLAFLRGYPNDPYSLHREGIFRAVLARFGVPVDEALFLEGNYDVFESYNAVSRLAASGRRFDAVVAANDLMALGAARALAAHGLRVPEDVVLSGFDDTQEATKMMPALTTVRQPMLEMACLAARMLLERIEARAADGQPRAGDGEVALVNSEFVARGSTAGAIGESWQDAFEDRDAMRRRLARSLSGLKVPEGSCPDSVADALWRLVRTGEKTLASAFDALMPAANLSPQCTHWWASVSHQVETIGLDVLRRAERREHEPILLAELSPVKERTWAARMDHEFDVQRLQHTRADVQLTISSSTDTVAIVAALQGWLETIGARRCFLVRYDHPGSAPRDVARLVCAFRDGLAVAVRDAPFATVELLPEPFRPELADGQLVLEPVHAGGDHYGYLLLDPTGLEHSYVDSIASSMANAFRSQHLIRSLETHARTLERANEDLAKAARHDPLTALPNRLHFQEHLRELCSPSGTEGATLMFIDLDGFKLVNDTLGHDAGDRLLCEVAERLTETVAGSDGAEGFVARLGGDEYVVTMRHRHAGYHADEDGRRILAALARPYRLDGKTATVSGSIGCARYPHDGTDIDVLVRQADGAMYRAKHAGKNRIVFHSPEPSVVAAGTRDPSSPLSGIAVPSPASQRSGSRRAG